MDHFGIGQAMRGITRIYCQSARRSGRTESLINSLKDGDRIVFSQSQEADRVRRLCRERKLKVKCIVINPKTPERIFDNPVSDGRTIFDHSWIEEYYFMAIEKAQNEIKYFEMQSSGWLEVHEDTQRKAQEISKWMI